MVQKGGEKLLKLNFLYGRIVTGKYLVKVEEMTKEFDLPKDKVSNDLIVQHIQSFSKTDENGYSYYSGFFSKILNKKTYSPQPVYDEIELPNQGVLEGGSYIRLVFDFSKTPEITVGDIEIIQEEFPKSFKESLGLNFLDVRLTE